MTEPAFLRLARVFRAAAPFGLLAASVGFAACSSSSGGAPATPAKVFTAAFALPASGAPDFLDVPFPSDLNVAADGTIHFDYDLTGTAPKGLNKIFPSGNGAKYAAESLAYTRGWGVYGGAIFELDDGAPDSANLPTGQAGSCAGAGAPVVFVDVDAGKTVDCQANWNDDAPSGQADTIPVLTVRTARGLVLPEHHQIAVLLTSSITSKGTPLAPTVQFASLRDGTRGSAAAQSYGAAIDKALTIGGVDKAKVVTAAVYTTGKVTEEIRQARELARAGAVPTLKWGAADVAPVQPAKFTSESPLPTGWTASLDDLFGKPSQLSIGGKMVDDPNWGGDNPGVPHDSIAAMGVASFDAPSFLVYGPGKDFGVAQNGTWYHGSDGKLAVNPAAPTAKIWVTFIVPKGAMPASGWPTVVFQHGMAGQRGDSLTFANSLARQGWAVAAIEVIEHGTRGDDAAARGDKKSDYERPTSTYHGPDGFSDKTSDGSNFSPNQMFGDLYRIAGMRDQFKQSAIDHTTLRRVLGASPTLDGLASGGVAPKIDGTKVAYVGDSLGGIIGALTAGIEPDHAGYVLDVPGGGVFTEIAPGAPKIYVLLKAAASLFYGFDHAQLPPWHPVLQIFQHVMDGGDPIAVAGTVMSPLPIGSVTPKPRNVLMIEVLADELVANRATDALARAMGVVVAKPHGPTLYASLVEADGAAGVHDVPKTGVTGVVVQMYPAEHGSNLFNKNGTRSYSMDGPDFSDLRLDPFPRLADDLKFTQDYLGAQTAALGFLGDALAGKAPTVTWSKGPATVTDK
jgi:dienelactone hydrolase